jgi:hypothetical protein
MPQRGHFVFVLGQTPEIEIEIEIEIVVSMPQGGHVGALPAMHAPGQGPCVEG